MAHKVANGSANTTNNPIQTNIPLIGTVENRRSIFDAIGDGHSSWFTVEVSNNWVVIYGTVHAGSPAYIEAVEIITNKAGTDTWPELVGEGRVFCAIPVEAMILVTPNGQGLVAPDEAGVMRQYRLPAGGGRLLRVAESGDAIEAPDADGSLREYTLPPGGGALVASLPAGRNLLIDAEGRYNSLGNTTASDGAYGHDMWYALTQTAAVTLSTLTDVQDGIPSMIRLTQEQATAQRIGYAQALRATESKALRGKKVTLSGTVRCSASQAIGYAILGWKGTQNSVTKDVVNNWTSTNYTAGNFFISSNLTVLAVGSVTPAANTIADIASLTETVPSDINNLIVMIWSQAAMAQNATLDFRLQLERGSHATEFECRDDIELIEQQVEVFARSAGNIFIAPGRSQSETQARFMLRYKTKWRQPAVIFIGDSFTISRDGVDPTVAAADMGTVGTIGTKACHIFANISGLSVMDAAIFLGINNNDTKLVVDSRL